MMLSFLCPVMTSARLVSRQANYPDVLRCTEQARNLSQNVWATPNHKIQRPPLPPFKSSLEYPTTLRPQRIDKRTGYPKPLRFFKIPDGPLRSPFRAVREGQNPTPGQRIKVIAPPPSKRKAHPLPLEEFVKGEIASLDPRGVRARFFRTGNPDGPRVGDIMLVTFKGGEPFAGTCMNIRRNGTDTAILLRSKKNFVGVELWVKVFSPNVRAVEVVKRSEKKQRRARLTFLRHPKHDKGNVDAEVDRYLQRRRLVRADVITSPFTKKRPLKGSSGR